MAKSIPVLMAAVIFSALAYQPSTSIAAIDNLIGARGEGIGFSYIVFADDPYGALYNPAGPAFVRGWQAQLQYYRPSKYGLASVNEAPYDGLAGFNYYKEDFGNIVFNAHQFGSSNNPTTITTATNINLAFAREFEQGISGGVGFKYNFETNYGKRTSFDMDLGVSYRPQYRFALAATAENVLRSKFTPDYLGLSEHLDRRFRFASAYFIPMSNNLGSILAGWQIQQSGETSTINTSLYNIGTEWWIGTFNEISFGMRGGYTFGETTVGEAKIDYNRWHAGMSLNFNLKGRDLRIDYAFRSYPFESSETLPSDNFISITYGWGGVPNYGRSDDETYDLTEFYEAQLKPPSAPNKIAIPDKASQTEQPQTFQKLNFIMSVTDMHVAGTRKIVFYIRPENIIGLTSWELYLFGAKLKNWSEEAVDVFALHKIEGKGIPPLNVVWNAKLKDGSILSPGKYFYVLLGVDKYGQRYMSDWYSFKLK